MTRNYILLAMAFLCFMVKADAQSVRPVDLVRQHQNLRSEAVKVNPFVSAQEQAIYRSEIENNIKLPEELREYSILTLSRNPLESFSRTSDFIEVALPNGEESLDLQLVEVNLYGDATHQTYELPSNRPTTTTSSKYYRGIVKGEETSLVSLSVSNDEITGFIAKRDGESLFLGKLKDKEEHILYDASNLMQDESAGCSTRDDLDLPQSHNEIYRNNFVAQNTASEAVKLYLEIDYDVYQSKGYSVSNTTNFVNAAMNNVMTIFANENINTELSPLYIWTSSSPYTSNDPGTVTQQFISTRPTFDGHLGGLLTRKPIGGVAFSVGGLCLPNQNAARMSSEIKTYNDDLPYYSWNTDFITHEFGHLMGSKHTHACAWNGNNTPIDGCYASEGDCPRGPSVSKGTIMSYCHLNVGKDLTLGFGPQPGDAIRAHVAACLGSNIPAEPEVLSDTDQDGVANLYDLDNDNDGIIDSNECNDVSTFNINIGDGGGSKTFNTGSKLYKAVVDLNTVDNSVQLKVNGIAIDRIYEFEGGAISPSTEYLIKTESGPFIAPWVANRNGLPRLRATFFHDGSVYLEGTTSYNSTTLEPVLRMGATEPLSVAFSNNTSITVVNPDEGGADGLTGVITAYKVCDFDNDGMDNRLDLDSDNDGCVDALEGSSNISATAVTSQNTLGTTVNTNGIPTVAGNGQAVGTALDATAVNDECEALDTEAPTQTSFLVADITTNSASIYWSTSSDNVGVEGYKIYINNSLVQTSTGTSYDITGLAPNTSYTVKLTAFDAAGNESTPAIQTFTTEQPIIEIDDMDNDGVADENDLDNDNDGILDADEIIEETAQSSFSIGNGGGTRTFSNQNVSKIIIDFNTIDNSLLVKLNGQAIDKIYETESRALNSSTEYLIKPSSGSYSRPWNPNRNDLPRLRMILDEDGTINLFGTRTETSTSLEPVLRVGATLTPTLSYGASTTIDIQNFNEGGPDALTGNITFVSRNNDADNDGIENKFDKDADNDGCPDALEGSKNIDATDLSINNDLGTVVDANGVPTIVSGGQEIGAALDASVKACSNNPTDGGDNGNSCFDIKVDLKTDRYGSETTWTLTNSAGDVVLSNDGTLISFTEYTEEACLPADCYTFTINDSYGDGICCSYGSGYYKLFLDGKEVATGGSFRRTESYEICTQSASAQQVSPYFQPSTTQKDSVYPNPVTDGKFIINHGSDTKSTYKVYDLSGSEVLKGSLNMGENIIETGNLKGIYFIQTSDYKKVNTTKIIIQ